MQSRVAWFFVFALVVTGCGAEPPDPEYLSKLEEYRQDRDAGLPREDGWLSLIGLVWLEPGENRFGSDSSNAIVLPADASPPVAGSFVYDGSAVRLEVESGVEIRVGDEVVTEWELPLGESGDATPLQLGRLKMFAILRGDRHAVRIKDPESPARTEFAGLDFYEADSEYRLDARLERYETPREMSVPTVFGTTATMTSPGVVAFELHGRRYKLEAVTSGDDLWFIFKDKTSGKQTYGAGRYLYAKLVGDDVDLDFNYAYNPPCAFTPFATCPLPPPGNRLDVPIEAGEKSYAGH